MSPKQNFDTMTAPVWRSDQPNNQLPPLPPALELESRAVLKTCIEARAALAELKQAAGDAHRAFVRVQMGELFAKI